jgi:hypothetical protein
VTRRISCLSVLVILKERCDAESCNRNGLKGGLLNYKAGDMVIINVALWYEAVPTPFQLFQQAWIGKNIFTCLLMDRSESMHKWHMPYIRTSLLQQSSYTIYGKILLSLEVVMFENNTQRVLGRLFFCIVTVILINSYYVISGDNHTQIIHYSSNVRRGPYPWHIGYIPHDVLGSVSASAPGSYIVLFWQIFSISD